MSDQETHFVFDPMVRKYDRCNHLFSLGVDHFWRKKLIEAFHPHPHQQVLDLWELDAKKKCVLESHQCGSNRSGFERF
ncbi:MAG: class I SAM-dependent methyltransferase [Planctomycetota bacterium]